MADEFNFDETQMQLTDQELTAMDQAFLATMQEKTENSATEDSNDAFTFWFLIILLLVFVFFVVMGIVMLVKGRRRRYEYAVVGYRT